jgi:hypothetical protein
LDLGDPSALDTTTAVTVAGWVVPGATHSGTMYSHIWSDGNHRHLAIGVHSSGAFRFALGNGSSHTTQTVGSYSTDTLYHIALAWDDISDTWQFYANGKQIGSGSFSGPLDLGTSDAYIGRVSWGLWFQGKIYDVRVYNRRLIAPEIRAIYNPATRWDLCEPLLYPVVSAPAAAAGNLIGGKLVGGGILKGRLVR